MYMAPRVPTLAGSPHGVGSDGSQQRIAGCGYDGHSALWYEVRVLILILSSQLVLVMDVDMFPARSVSQERAQSLGGLRNRRSALHYRR